MKTRQIVSTIISLLLITLMTSSCMSPPYTFDEDTWHNRVKKQKTEMLYAPNTHSDEFFNPWMPMREDRLKFFLRWRFSKKAKYTNEQKAYKAKVINNLILRISKIPEKDFIAWVGHASFLLRINGEYWFTDPMLSDRALLPKRVTPPAIRTSDLSKLSGHINVIISHNHYDHLDKKTIKSMPESTRFFVPKGLGNFIRDLHGGEIRELNWWESAEVESGTKIVSLPAQHWSRRIGQDLNTTLWASYMIVTDKTSIYFGGDSGYFAGYREIGKKFPNISYALLPVTAYHPRWFMHYPHMNPSEAIDAFKDLRAGYFVPTQWGAFQLGDNPPGLPAMDLRKDIKNRNLDPSKFIIMNIGQIEIIKYGDVIENEIALAIKQP